jgi:hypothetical protein
MATIMSLILPLAGAGALFAIALVISFFVSELLSGIGDIVEM